MQDDHRAPKIWTVFRGLTTVTHLPGNLLILKENNLIKEIIILKEIESVNG